MKRRKNMSNHFKRVLALLLTLVMVIGLLPTIALAAEEKEPESTDEVVEVVTPEHEAELQADVFDDISTLLSGLNKRYSSLKREDFYEAADDVKEIVLASDTYVENSLVENGSGFYWQTTTGITCGYFPEHEYDMAVMRANNASSETRNATASACTNYVSSAAGDDDVCLVGPMYSEDTSFTEQYGNEARDIAAELGGTAYKLTNKNATVTNIADAISKCRVVIFDSHGNTDWGYFDGGSDGEGEADCVTKANTSYLCLSSGNGITNADMAYVSKVNPNSANSTFCHAYADTDGNYVIDGTAIANHMTKNAPNSMLWMAICLGMATPGMEQPLRNKGVAVVYGYSQSVSFSGEYEYEEDFWDQMIAGKTVAEAASYMKSRNGNWDPAYSNYSLSRARSNYVAFPIVVSDQDTYPGQRTSSTYDGTVDAVQTVRSTWKLKEDLPQDPCTITLKAGTSTWRTVNTTTNTSASLPSYTGTVPTGYTFAGWTASQISGTTQSAPTLYNGSYSTGSNTAITLYACFSKTEGGQGGGTGAWTLLENASTLSSGMKVVFASESQGVTAGDISSAVMTNVESTFSSDGKTITSLGSGTAQMTVGGSSGAWTFANSDGDLLGATAVKKLAWGSGTTTWSVSVSDGSATIQNGTEANGRFLYNVGSPRFTTYTSGTSVSMLLPEIYYMNGTAGTTTYTTTLTVCSHTYAETDRLDATCTEAGTIEYTCSKCGGKYYDDIPALGHDYGAFTSNNNGTHSKTCRRTGCGDVVTEDCSYTSTTSGATTTFTCSVCNYSYSTVLDTYTVSYNVLGSVVNTASCVEGQSVTLPATATAVDGYTFAGWTTAAIDPESTTAPTVLTGSYEPTANVTLYAVYTRTEAGTGTGSGDYEKVTSTSGLTNGQYLVVYEDGNVAFNGALSTLDAISNTISVTISNNKIASNSTTDAAAFTFNSSDGSFKGTGGKYFGFAKDDNGLTSSSTALSNTVSIDSDGDAVIKSSGGSYLRYNKSSGQTRFRYYKSSTYTGQQPIQLYKKGAGSSSTTYYTTAPVYVAPCEHTNTSVVNAAAATCTSAGYTGDTVCDDCGTTVATGTAIAVLGHDYGAFSSNNNGTHSKTCSRCSDKVTEDCSFTTSTSGTTVTHTCSVCNYSYTSELNTFDVTYSVPAGVSSIAKATVIEGNSITLPTAGAVDGYTFAGWTTAAIDPESTTAPTVLTGSYQPTANVTLYALYTRTEAGTGSGAEGYYLATETPAVGDEIIIAIKNGNDWYCLPNGNTNGVYSITADELTVTNGRAVDTEDNTFVVAENKGYTCIKSTTGDYYLALNSGKLAMNGWGDTKVIAFEAGTESGTYYIIGAKSGTSGNEGRALDYSGSVFSCDGENGGSPVYIFVNSEGGSGDATYYTTAPVVETPCTHENTTLTGAVAATCEAAGYTGDYVCDDCGTTVTTGTAIAALGHDLVAGAIIAPTCTTPGYTEYNCSRCDYSENKDEVAALGHDLSWDGVVGNGISHTLACARCDYTENEACTIVNGSCSVCGYVAKVAEIGDYARVTAALDDWSGTYLIVYEGSSYAFNGSLSTPNAAANYNTVSIVDGIVVGDDTVDAYAVTIEKVEGTDYYTIKLGSGKYMGNTGTATGINASTTKYQNAISLDAEGNAIIANTSGTNTYNIRFNSGSSSNRFAFYGTSTGYAVKLYKRVECDHNWGTGAITTPATCTAEGVMTYTCSICSESKTEAIPMAAHTPAAYPEAAASCTEPGSTGGTYCSVCNTELTAATVIPALGHDLAWDGNVGDGNHTLACSRCSYTENEACTMVDGTCTICGYSEAAEVVVKISSAALRLGENIDLIYTASVPEDATNVYMTFTMNGETVTVEDDGTHTFAFTAINPQCMGDNVAAKLYATVSGTEYSDEIATYSVRQYCINKLADSSVTGTLRTLISDVLAYGAAAQTYMSHNAGALVNTGSDIVNPIYSTFTSLSGLNATFTGTAAESPCWIGASLDLSNNVAMVFRFASPNKTGLSVKVTYNGKTTTFSGTSITAVSGMSGVYEVKLTGIKATDFDETVSASFYKSSAQVGNMVSYSVNTYICAKQADNDANLAALVKALYNYGTSAKAYRPA